MENIYRDYFETLKSYLTILKIDENKIYGCSQEEINTLKKDDLRIPLAYEEYLSIMGKHFLFEFMDGENMAFNDLDYINKFAIEVFETNSLEIDKDFIVISERRYDYISLIYTDEENPKVWIISKYWDEEDGVNFTIRSNSFTELFNSLFINSLENKIFTFNYIPENTKNKKKYYKNKFIEYAEGLDEIKKLIDNSNPNNQLVSRLNGHFRYYYNINEKNIEIYRKKKLDLFNKIFNLFK